MTTAQLQNDARVKRAGAARSGRIVFLINSMEGGGAERAMANLLGHLLPHISDNDTHLVLLDDLPICQLLPTGLRVHVLDGKASIRRSLADLSRLWTDPLNRPDVCISFLARANVLNTLLARRFGHRAVISERVNTSSHIAASRAAPVLRWITRRIYPRADEIIAVSDGVAKDLVENFGVARQKMTVIGNVVDRDKLHRMAMAQPEIPLPDDFLLGIGRLVPNKNFALMLEAMAALPEAPPLVILGQGPEEGSLKDLAARLGLSHRVKLAGFVSNPYPVMARARALVSTSRAEGFPNTMVEALALGCPVIVTDCPSGPAEILGAAAQTTPPWSRSAHGIVIPMEDKAALQLAIQTLMDDTERADYASRAMQKGAEFRPEAVVDAYLNVIRRQETLSSNTGNPFGAGIMAANHAKTPFVKRGDDEHTL